MWVLGRAPTFQCRAGLCRQPAATCAAVGSAGATVFWLRRRSRAQCTAVADSLQQGAGERQAQPHGAGDAASGYRGRPYPPASRHRRTARAAPSTRRPQEYGHGVWRLTHFCSSRPARGGCRRRRPGRGYAGGGISGPARCDVSARRSWRDFRQHFVVTLDYATNQLWLATNPALRK